MLTDNIRGSIIKFCNDLITQLANEGVGMFQFADWDTHSSMHEIPNANLLGPAGLGVVDNGTFQEIGVAIGVSTYEDQNLFRNWAAIGRVFEKLRPGKQIAYYESTTQQVMGYMVALDGTTVAPMSRAEIRPFQFVQVSLVLDGLSSV